ncbi:MAG: cyanobactin biosynthesis PatC/TenC/TruC family protein [Trichormus sp.]
MSKERETTANSNPAQSKNPPNSEKTEEIKSHLLATGLEDYGFWWQEMAKAQSDKSEPDKPFRRGRIWC